MSWSRGNERSQSCENAFLSISHSQIDVFGPTRAQLLKETTPPSLVFFCAYSSSQKFSFPILVDAHHCHHHGRVCLICVTHGKGHSVQIPHAGKSLERAFSPRFILFNQGPIQSAHAPGTRGHSYQRLRDFPTFWVLVPLTTIWFRAAVSLEHLTMKLPFSISGNVPIFHAPRRSHQLTRGRPHCGSHGDWASFLPMMLCSPSSHKTCSIKTWAVLTVRRRRYWRHSSCSGMAGNEDARVETSDVDVGGFFLETGRVISL